MPLPPDKKVSGRWASGPLHSTDPLLPYQSQAMSKVENAYSNWHVVQCGVQQASLLGPLLFNIYIYDITHITKNMELRLCADDTTIYAASNFPL